jgi:hypothetical protein
LAVALGPACYSLLVGDEGQPEALVAAEGLFESCTLAQAACEEARKGGVFKQRCVGACVCMETEGGCVSLSGACH